MSGELFGALPLFEIFFMAAIWGETEMVRKMEMKMARELLKRGDGDN
jgi:hypothetical protein